MDKNESEINNLGKVKNVTDIPEVFEDVIFDDTFSDEEDDSSYRTDLMKYEKTEFTEITNVGEINGHETCRFTGKTTWYDYINDDYSVGTFVGYCTQLHNNKIPFFTICMSINRKEEPTPTKLLDAYAFYSYVSLEELEME